MSLLLNAENILGYSGHISVRIPGTDNFLIQPVDHSRAQLRPEQLLVCGMDGKSLDIFAAFETSRAASSAFSINASC